MKESVLGVLYDILDDVKNHPEQYDLKNLPLKRCPFCGANANLVCDDYPCMTYYIQCQGCEAISTKYGGGESEESAKIYAVDSWNRRVKS